MAYTYLFFQPARLPLRTEDLSPDTVLVLRDIEHIKASLAQVLPGLEWALPTWGHATVLGHGVEFHLPENACDGPPGCRRCATRWAGWPSTKRPGACSPTGPPFPLDAPYAKPRFNAAARREREAAPPSSQPANQPASKPAHRPSLRAAAPAQARTNCASGRRGVAGTSPCG
jgi:hypothetical protein